MAPDIPSANTGISTSGLLSNCWISGQCDIVLIGVRSPATKFVSSSALGGLDGTPHVKTVDIIYVQTAIKTLNNGLGYWQSMWLNLNGWELGITFSACHFLPGHSKCNRLHGHNYALHMKIEGEVGQDGIIFDFIEAKRLLRDIASELDHCVLMPSGSDVIKVELTEETLEVRSSDKFYSFPASDVVMLDIETVSAEMLATHILSKVMDSLEFPSNIKSISVGVDEGLGQGAWACKEL